MADTSRLNELVTYALTAAIKKRKYDCDREVIKDCIEYGAIITIPVIMKYIEKAVNPRDHNDMPLNYISAYNKDSIFEALIDKLPADTVFDHEMVKACMFNANTYYLETILSTQRYQDNYCNNSLVLYHAASDGRVPSHAVHLLVKHGFTTTAVVMDFITCFNSSALLRLIAAGIDLTNHHSAIFTFISSSYQQDPTLITRKTNAWKDYQVYPGKNNSFYIRDTLKLLIDNLRSNPHAISHFMTLKYLIFEIIQPSIDQSDVSTYIWNQYIDSTIKIYGYYIIEYK